MKKNDRIILFIVEAVVIVLVMMIVIFAIIGSNDVVFLYGQNMDIFENVVVENKNETATGEGTEESTESKTEEIADATEVASEEPVEATEETESDGEDEGDISSGIYPQSEFAYDPYEREIVTRGGILQYYCQDDPRWANYLCGGRDKMSTHGCGPTVFSMIISSYTNTKLTPAMAAEWAYKNGYYSSGGGSYHSLMKAGIESYGLKSESVATTSKQQIIDGLNLGKIYVALMGPGHFTQGGHFIIICALDSENRVFIADPNNPANSDVSWDLDLILSELSKSANSGGPLWEVTVM